MTLEIRVFIFGCDDRRCEVTLRKDIPQQAQNNFALLDGWAQKTIMSIGYDMKHTQRWDCENCGEPARETWFDPRPSASGRTPCCPSCACIHHLCEAGDGPCHTAVETRVRELALQPGSTFPPPPPSVHISKPPEQVIPLASSCVKCLRDETGALGSAISRCSGCKLTSVKCQKEDWPRHGKICKTIKQVEWYNWPSEPKIATASEPDSDVTVNMPGAYV
ncbi:hypothetical protein B0H11DRAFT_2135876 [Mycena galericulata]|nr:hypothetical protein B0H11DRAFT_2135876 [Mycena galericulata]